MIIDKSEFKSLKKEGGGFLGIQCFLLAYHERGLEQSNSGEKFDISLYKNGLFVNSNFGEKYFFSNESIISVAGEDGQLIIEIQENGEDNLLVFTAIDAKDLLKMQSLINEAIGVNEEIDEEPIVENKGSSWLIDKDEYKRLKKEGGGIFKSEAFFTAVHEGGLDYVKVGSDIEITLMKKGLLLNIVLGDKLFIPIENVQFASISEKKLAIFIEEDEEEKILSFTGKNSDLMLYMQNSIAKLIGFKAQTAEEIFQQKKEQFERELESSETYCIEVDKETYKRLIKEGGGLMNMEGYCSGKLVEGLDNTDVGTRVEMTLRRNGLFISTDSGEKYFVAIEYIYTSVVGDDNGVDALGILIGEGGETERVIMIHSDEPKNLVRMNNGISAAVGGKTVSVSKYMKGKESAAREEAEERLDELKREKVPYCPKCHSTSLTYLDQKLDIGRAMIGDAIAGDKGAILGGLSGSKGKLKCLNCGHTWKI